jgi:septum formation inhibitor MinC
MSQAPSVAFAVVDGEPGVLPANVTLRGTTRGMEIWIGAGASAEAIAARLSALLAEAPSFFAGSDARVAFEGELPGGALASLEDVARRFELKLLEVAPVGQAKRPRTNAAVIRRKLAEGSGPIAEAAPVAVEAVEAPGVEAVLEIEAMAAEPVAEIEAAPVAVELANTAPYCIVQLTEEAAQARREAEEAAATSAAVIEAAVVHAVGATQGAEALPPAAGAALAEAALAEAALVAGAAPASADDAGVRTALARAETAPVVAPVAADGAALAEAIRVAAEAMAAELVAARPAGPRLVLGPVRSGVIVEHAGHVIVMGDVNPGAEVRAEGSIIVLGRLRGVAHAAIGRDAGCIVALSFQPQQLRIGRMVARAGDADRPGGGAEIAYVTGEAIVVERFLGRLPSGLAASM